MPSLTQTRRSEVACRLASQALSVLPNRFKPAVARRWKLRSLLETGEIMPYETPAWLSKARGSKRDIVYLAGLLSDGDNVVRRNAATAFMRMGVDQDTVLPATAIAALRDTLSTPDRDAQTSVALALCYAAANERTRDDVLPVLRGARNAGNPTVQSAAAWALREYPLIRERDMHIRAYAQKPLPTAPEKTDHVRQPRAFWAVSVSTIKKFNPVEIYRTFQASRKSLQQAKAQGVVPETSGNLIFVRNSLIVKFAAAIAISEFVGTYIGAPAVGSLIHYTTGNAYKGVIGTIIGDYFPAVLTFDIAWYALNRSYYAQSSHSFIGRAKAFLRDILPIHGVAIMAALPAYAIGATLSSLVIAGINTLFPGLAHKLPIPLLSEFFNVGVAEVFYLSIVGGLAQSFDTIGTIAKRVVGVMASKKDSG